MYPKGRNPNIACSPTDPNNPCITTDVINQNVNNDGWVQLRLNNNVNTTFNMSRGGYVGLAASMVSTNGQLIGIDAVKFVKSSNPTVTSPNGGERWNAGQQQTITWSGFTGSAVRVDLYKGSSLNRTLVSSTPNDGSLAWTIPSTQTTGTDYRVRVSAGTQQDLSNGYFTIQQPVATPRVIAPNGGERWNAGQQQTITWSGFTGSAVRVDLYKGSSLNRTLASSTPNDGSLAWTIPSTQTTGTDYRVRVSAGTQQDLSDGYFTIIQPSRSYSVDRSSTTNGGGTWGSILNMNASLSGSRLTLTVTKRDGSAWTSSGNLYFKVGTYESYGVNRGTVYMTTGSRSASHTHDLANFTGTYPKQFYARFESGNGGYAWVGPITVTER